MPEFPAPDGARLYYQDEGEGLPVLALAGLSRNGSDFDYLRPHLPEGVRFIRLDYRGRGASEWTGPETYNAPTEAADGLALLDHLGLETAAVLGTSRGGLIAMTLAAMAKDRLTGVCLVDIGPELGAEGLATIREYIGRNPSQKTYAEAASMRSDLIDGFENVPDSRWAEEVRIHYRQTPDGLAINYDPALREAVVSNAAVPDLWPLFTALEGLPLALIRGANSRLLLNSTADEMRRRRPDMIFADVPDRGHVPFLDEPTAVEAVCAWIGAMR